MTIHSLAEHHPNMRCLSIMRSGVIMRLIFLVFVLSAVVSLRVSFGQTVKPDDGLAISVSHIDSNKYGFLITVEITNRSRRPLFLPQSSDWPVFKYRPKTYSLNVEQWSDGKTNLSTIGQKLQSVNPRFGFLSVGPCRDAVENHGWIRLSPGGHIPDQIQAVEPSSVDYGNSACPLRIAHLGDKLRVSVTAFPSARWLSEKAISTWSDFPLLPH